MFTTAEKLRSLAVMPSSQRKGTAGHSKPDAHANYFIDKYSYLLRTRVVQYVLVGTEFDSKKVNIVPVGFDSLPKAPQATENL